MEKDRFPQGGFLITDTVSDSPGSPSRPRLPGGAVARWFSREGTLVVLAGLAISAVFNWRIVVHPRSTVVASITDPLLQAWELAWNRRFLTGGDYWTANILYPSKDNFAFTDSLLGYLPLSLFGDGPHAAVMRYNVAYVFAFALAFVGCYLLTRQLGGSWQAAALAGAVFAWAPWRLAQNSHLNILSTGGIALALFALARGHGYSLRWGRRPQLTRPWWAFAGWLIAAWQVTIGFAIGLPFVYVMTALGLVTVAVNVVRRRQVGLQLNVINGAGLMVFLLITYLMTIPYLRVVEEYKFTRSLADLRTYSPPPKGLLTASDQGWLWPGGYFNNGGAGEQLVFPGLVVILVALVGLVVSAWPTRVRITLGISVLVVTILALGTSFFGGEFTYLPLWENLPGWTALRTPGRLILWTILLLALLAAGAVTKLTEILAEHRQASPSRNRLVALALVLPAIGALLEGVPDQTYNGVPEVPPGLRQVFAESHVPILILPVRTDDEASYLLWSTDGFPVMANGTSGNVTLQFEEMVDAASTFPDNYSIRIIRKYGIEKVVVIKASAAHGIYAEAVTKPLDGLPVTKTESADVVVFTLR
jgi:hypothetical protein